MSKTAQVEIRNGVEYIYQPIHFKAGIMKEYYVGDSFVGIVDKKYFEPEELSDLIQRAGIEGFMPELVSELRSVIGVTGKDRKLYDGYEFGREIEKGIDEVIFYFLIKKENYEKIMRDIKYWSIAKNLDHLIYFDVKNIQYATL
jgi:hypothetical protein